MRGSSDFMKGAEFINEMTVQKLVQQMIDAYVESLEDSAVIEELNVEDQGDFLDGVYEELDVVLRNKNVLLAIAKGST